MFNCLCTIGVIFFIDLELQFVVNFIRSNDFDILVLHNQFYFTSSKGHGKYKIFKWHGNQECFHRGRLRKRIFISFKF